MGFISTISKPVCVELVFSLSLSFWVCSRYSYSPPPLKAYWLGWSTATTSSSTDKYGSSSVVLLFQRAAPELYFCLTKTGQMSNLHPLTSLPLSLEHGITSTGQEVKYFSQQPRWLDTLWLDRKLKHHSQVGNETIFLLFKCPFSVFPCPLSNFTPLFSFPTPLVTWFVQNFTTIHIFLWPK